MHEFYKISKISKISNQCTYLTDFTFYIFDQRFRKLNFILITYLFSKLTQMAAINTLVSNIVNSRSTQALLEAHGLKAHKVTWEDTGRSKKSCWGPNISDMTLVVKSGKQLMPVIRRPNFSDVTDDMPINTFQLNYKGSLISLEQLLKNLGVYDARDTQVLTSSQCCVLPVELGQKTQFAVQLFNYQSSHDEPAVLVILASKNGTSMQVLDSSNTKLFFDDDGIARWFSAERLEDVRIRQKAVKTKVDSYKEMTNEEKLDNSILMIQVPLLVTQKKRSAVYGGSSFTRESAMACSAAFGSSSFENCEESCDMSGGFFDELVYRSVSLGASIGATRGMDMGQLGLGDAEGKYTGTRGVTLKRDPAFPVRCTFQYYRVTDRDNIDEKDIIDIKEQINQSLKVATGHGSLVLNPSSQRVTEPVLPDQPVLPTIVEKPNPWVNSNGSMASFV